MGNDQELPRLDEGSGEIVAGLEGSQWNAESFGDFFQRVAHANAVPSGGCRLDLVGSCPEGGELVRRYSIEQLRGTAGQRQVTIKNGRPETAICAFAPALSANYLVLGTESTL